MSYFDYLKNPNSVDLYISNRIKNLAHSAVDAKAVRNIAFDAIQQDGLIPAQAKVGWLGSPDRRKACTAKHHEYLDGLNRLFNVAKYHFGEDGKKSKAGNNANSENPHEIELNGALLANGHGSFIVNFAGAQNHDQIAKFVKSNRGQRVVITVSIK
ncbi:hypothetical protein M1B72_08980 [Geomonas paludis]|uniref:Uncharacterized protein n=1 Tax=Geomonas paludis TaxID=2740185 RepID=A0ABY4LMV4_9BACT|nr:hypothetical protein [Geomonas paludis]UPU37823.1 hypothetical protein M1B72_08980 [Geomonas paludis]